MGIRNDMKSASATVDNQEPHADNSHPSRSIELRLGTQRARSSAG